MSNDEMKKQLIKRYEYLYENTIYLLAPFIVKEDDKIYLKNINIELLEIIEEFLLSDLKLEDIYFYQELEKKKNDKYYLMRVNNGLNLVEDKNIFTIWIILKQVRDFIESQIEDFENKNLKLIAIDEYFKIARYTNDGNVYLIGYHGNGQINNVLKRTKKENGVKNNNFINYLVNNDNKRIENNCIISEDEKQQIYLKYHDELPWDLMTHCFENCQKIFYLDEKGIFFDNGSFGYVCPHCGFFVIIDEEILSRGIKERIKEGKKLCMGN